MAILPVGYEDFQSSNQGFTDSGGPWVTIFPGGLDVAQCNTVTKDWCNGSCLECQIVPPDSAGQYHITYSTNISVNMAHYGGSNSLDFTWSFWPLYIGTNIAAGWTYPIHTQVNDANYDDTMVASDYYGFYDRGLSWDGSPTLSHSGTISVNRGLSGDIGYISIAISYTPLATSRNEYIAHFTKGISFKITTPRRNVVAAAATSTTSSSLNKPTTGSSPSTSASVSSGSMVSSTVASFSSLSSIDLLNPSSDASGFLGPSIGTIPPSQEGAQTTTFSTAVKVGVALGCLAFVLLIIALLWYRRRRTKSSLALERCEVKPVAYREKGERPGSIANSQLNEASFSIPAEPLASKSTFCIVSNTQPVPRTPTTPRTSICAAARKSTSTLSYEPPPVYGITAGSPHYAVPPVSAALALFANANRALISEDLEARLTAAGYLPADNPDNLSEEEWRMVHNVTKLELMRLRALYAARDVCIVSNLSS